MTTQNKLKTLKDFKRKQYSEGNKDDKSIVKYFNERELKAEAVKWVKLYKKENILQDAREWIKHFFNLTEKEIQDA